MRRFKRRQRHSLPFGLFLAVAGALLLPAAVAPRANAGSTDYWNFELSQPQGVLINQPLASNYNLTLASSVASAEQPSVFQPLVPDANATWIGGISNLWSTAGNWTAGGPPGAGQTATFNAASANTTISLNGITVGTILFDTASAAAYTMGTGAVGSQTLTLSDGGAITVNSTVTNNQLFNANVNLGTLQTTTSTIAFTNNSTTANLTIAGNVTGGTIGGGAGTKTLALAGSGNGLISGVIGPAGTGPTVALTKSGTGTWTLSGANVYSGTTTVNGGTLLVNNTLGSGTGGGNITVNNAGTTLGGTGAMAGTVTVNAGANIAPGNGGNNTAILSTGALTLAATSNFRVDINGTIPGVGYDVLNVASGGVTITNSNLVVTVGTTLSLGQTFLILNKAAGGAITGTFAGIPQGGTVTGSDGTVFQVSYTGLTGNDIVLTVVQAAVPEPSTWIGGAFAIAGLAFMQRRRLRKLLVTRESFRS